MSGTTQFRAERASSGLSARQWKWFKFECHADPGPKVFIAGTFNKWKPSALDKLRDGERDGSFGILLKLRRGQHQYKFLVDGEWLSGNEDQTNNRVADVL